MKYSIHKSQVSNDTKTIQYHRDPTKEEIKFGYGAIHYEDFDFQECFNSIGIFRKTIISKIDGLKYHYI